MTSRSLVNICGDVAQREEVKEVKEETAGR
jgi:hypothetical protein